MSSPISLHDREYYEHLRNFRDDALVESHLHGQRRKLGALAFGTAHASWRTEEGGSAYLTDEGFRFNDTTLFPFLPTTFRIIKSFGEPGIEVVTFKMDIDDIGYIDVYRNLISNGSFMDIAKAELSRYYERLHDLHWPSDEDRELLYTEMQRGASGLYPIEFTPEDYE